MTIQVHYWETEKNKFTSTAYGIEVKIWLLSKNQLDWITYLKNFKLQRNNSVKTFFMAQQLIPTSIKIFLTN